MPEPSEVTFAGLLKQKRTRAQLTQEQLADAANLSPRSISDLERGIYLTARKETARLLADALNLAGAPRIQFQAAAARGRVQAEGSRELGMAAGGVAARELPREADAFIGRGPELRRLVDAAAAAGAVGLYTIGGMAGVGKTAFAVHAARQLAPGFPDGQIFLELHAHTAGQRAVDSADALASLLREVLGIPAEQIPAAMDERSRLWRDRLTGKQLLLLLDDAEGSDQVQPLLPGTAGSLVLITSRKHLTALEGAHEISLDTLSADEAARLLVRLAERPGLSCDEPAVRDITRLCGYLPLAIGMLARQLHHHDAWTATALASDLTSARNRLELMRAENSSVAAAFDLSYRDLAPGLQRLFRRLGMHPGTEFDAYAAAALGDIDLPAARESLDTLYGHYLLTEPAKGRYRFHHLVREHARTLADAGPVADNEAAAERLLGYYLHTARAADRHLSRRTSEAATALPGFPPAHARDLPTREAALARMDVEHLNMRAAADYAARHHLAGYAIAIPAAMHGFLRFTGHLGEALALHNTALDAASQAGDRRTAARALTDLGDTQYGMRDYPAAAASLARALELYGDLGDRLGEANALTEQSTVRHLTGDNLAAAAGLTRALELYRDLGDRRGEATALTRLGNVQREREDYPAAAAALTTALQLYRELGDRLGEVHALNDLGAVQQATQDYEAATASHKRALERYRELRYRLGEANALNDLGAVQQATGDYKAAADSHQRALELYRELGDRLGEAEALTEQSTVRHLTGDSLAAAAGLTRALELYRDLGDRRGEATALTRLGDMQRETEDNPAATAP